MDRSSIDQIATLVSSPREAFLSRMIANCPRFQHATNGDNVWNTGLGAGGRHGMAGGSPDPVGMNEFRTRIFDCSGDITAALAFRIKTQPSPVVSRRLAIEPHYCRRDGNLRFADPSGKEPYLLPVRREVVHQSCNRPRRPAGGDAEIGNGVENLYQA